MIKSTNNYCIITYTLKINKPRIKDISLYFIIFKIIKLLYYHIIELEIII